MLSHKPTLTEKEVAAVNENARIFYDIIGRRRSIRDYLERPVEEEKLERILDTGRRAQSAANQQPWHFIVLKKEDRGDFDELLHREGFRRAPVIILACADRKQAWVRRYDGKNYAEVDTTVAMAAMVDAATAEDLGTCWIASFDPERAKQLLGIPKELEPIGMITIGYPTTPLEHDDKDRKKLSEIVHYGKW
jgi:nitroreductase